MAYNGSGTFLINTAGQPVVAGTVISSTTFNSLTADLATGLSTVITKDGQTTVTANIPMASFKFTGLGVGSAAGDSANLSQVQSTVTKLLTSVSGTDTITAVGAPVVAAYVAGQMFYFVATGDNTTSVTINIDGLGAKAVTRDGSVALVAGDIKSGEVVVVVYDGTRFQVVSQLNSAGNATFANVSITSALNVGGVATFSAGTAAAPAITTTGDTNTGIFFPAADTIGFTEGGVEAARFDSSGNLGVGTTSPLARLDVFKTSNDTVSRTNAVGAFGDYASLGAGLLMQQTLSSPYGFTLQAANAANSVQFPLLLNPSGGNVGIGTTAPASKLDVTGGFSTSTTAFTIYNNSASSASNIARIDFRVNNTFNGNERVAAVWGMNPIAASNNGGALVFGVSANGTSTTPSEVARFDQAGNLGIGTTSPGRKLDVVAVPASSNQLNGLRLQMSGVGTALSEFLLGTDGSGIPFTSIRTGNDGNAFMTFFTGSGPAERVRIESTGGFLVGTGSNVSINAQPQYTDNVSWNGAATAIYVGKSNGTGRSINAAGTVNASGADYAEYMEKAGEFVIAKGSVCGINAEGKLTNLFADAISFVVKSTNPSYVGGDSWGAEFKDDPEGLEAARQKVDRIAFSGQVPVNVLGATPGQYIVPINNNGAIKGVAVSNPTFEQYQSAVGKVIAVENDGRARIIVKIA